MISLVVARDRNGAIGKDGDIPWHAPEDLAFFQRETLGSALIMGRRTWDSLPVKPLGRRLNIVVSSRDIEGPQHVVRSVEAAIDAALSAGYARISGIGGYGIFEALLPLSQRMLITEVDLEVQEPDTWFPPFDATEWEITARLPLRAYAPRCELHEYIRRGV
ncbi:MAG: dihydrofolate reductase [Rhodobacteraceae bacterium]|jgi:dihydrofolate reductase|nr:dihydrofolate reductase [Paracoccaceae bacterium]